MLRLGSSLLRETWQGGLASSWAAGQGEVCVVPATEELETGLEPPTTVMPGISAVPWAVGGRGGGGEVALGRWPPLQTWLCWAAVGCGSSSPEDCSWVLQCLRSFKFLPERALFGRVSTGLNQFLLDNQGWLMAFLETDKSSHRPVSSAWDIAMTLGSRMLSVGSPCESINRFEVAPCASCSPQTYRTGSEDGAL